MPPTDLHLLSSELRRDLEALDSVVHALVDEFPDRVYLVCESREAVLPLAAARAVLLRHGGAEAADTTVEISYRSPPPPRRRVRFLDQSIDRSVSPTRVSATVRLEWRGQIFAGDAEGDNGLPSELRICAQAALRALEQVLDDAIGFELIGIKAPRIFDRDVVAILLQAEGPDAPLRMGFASGADPQHAAPLAVLNATNRLLGNYLNTSD